MAEAPFHDISAYQALKSGWGNGSRKFLILSIFAIGAITLVSFGLLLGFFRYSEPQWRPLTVVNPQVVTNGPLIDINSTVNVEAVKCNTSNNPINVSGELVWVNIEKPELIFDIHKGFGVLKEGCTRFSFKNTIPKSVKNYIKTFGPSKWKLAGMDRPVKKNGDEGESISWYTDTFQLKDGSK